MPVSAEPRSSKPRAWRILLLIGHTAMPHPSPRPLRLVQLGLAAMLAVITTLSLCSAGATQIVHTEPSTFSPIVIYEQSGERCMNFGSLQAPGRQTCIDIDDPDTMVFGYTR